MAVLIYVETISGQQFSGLQQKYDGKSYHISDVVIAAKDKETDALFGEKSLRAEWKLYESNPRTFKGPWFIDRDGKVEELQVLYKHDIPLNAACSHHLHKKHKHLGYERNITTFV